MKDINIGKIIIPILLVLILVGIIVGIIRFQSSRNTGLLIDLKPSENTSTDQDRITVEGRTNSSQNEVGINSQEVEVSNNGEFKADVALNPGENEIIVQVKSFDGRTQTKTIVVTRNDGEVPQNAPPVEKESPKETPVQAPSQPSATQAPAESGALEEGLSSTGPKENAALALTFLILFGNYWLRSRKKLKS